MASGEDKTRNFYEVLGLKKECSTSELRIAYKKLALRWHPDRCAAASGSSNFEEEAKQNFQAIQHAYSVLSDDNKRFLYDVGVYDSDDDENGMGDFLNEMAVMMSQTKPNENGDESFEELQELFEEMFHDDIDSFASGFPASDTCSYSGSSSSSSNQNSTGINFGGNKADNSSSFACHTQKFCLGSGGPATEFQEGEKSKKRNSRSHRRR
ncbi:Chaperone DnaJ-domain superfamily protein [Euphorbia peplus]|nr:Chaperone DnaJ-domain superfamily protein [Euphorbia peplus]